MTVDTVSQSPAFAGWRVVQVLTSRATGVDGRGSGYLVAPGVVLTAAHVLSDALSVTVLIDAGQEGEIRVEVDPGTCLIDPVHHFGLGLQPQGTDLAAIPVPGDVTGDRQIVPAKFARLRSADQAYVSVTASGFPAHKLREGAKNVAAGHMARDLEHIRAGVPLVANRRQGTLALYLTDTPPGDAITTMSPWAGFSGAAVWSAGYIVGVVGEHHRQEGPGRLTGRRIDAIFREPRVAELKPLRDALGLPDSLEELADAVPTPSSELIRHAYRTEAAQHAPAELEGRTAEQIEWTEFCADTEPYVWWQGPPWTGKTALASTFVIKPPAGVQVVHFFVTRGWGGHANAAAFLDAGIEQLITFSSIDQAPIASHAQKGTWFALLDRAAQLCEDAGTRLVLVVDGLDEDEVGAAPGAGQSSIASMLPRRPHPNLRIIVTSRPDPGVPDDVPHDHPLRSCSTRRLQRNAISIESERLARQELRDVLTGARAELAAEVVGYIAAAGGGLTISDLGGLTGRALHVLEGLIRGQFGRILESRTKPASERETGAMVASDIYLFAHDTLREQASELLGPTLEIYRAEVHRWMTTYCEKEWPPATPSYALTGYPAMLRETGALDRATDLALDSSRHSLLRSVSGTDYLAVLEIEAVLSLHAKLEPPDVGSMVGLAVWRHALRHSGAAIPLELVHAWATLNRLDHALAIARTLPEPDRRVRATNDLARVQLVRGRADSALPLVAEAEALAQSIASTRQQALALADIARTLAMARQARRSLAVAQSIADVYWRERTLAHLSHLLAVGGDWDAAMAIPHSITRPSAECRAWAFLARAHASNGSIAQARGAAAQAEAAIRGITDPEQRAEALIDFARAVACAGDIRNASLAASKAESASRDIHNPDRQARVCGYLVRAWVEVGQEERAIDLARSIDDSYRRARALTEWIRAMAEAGQTRQTAPVAAEAEAAARAVNSPRKKAQVLTLLARALAETGQAVGASNVANIIPVPDRRAWALHQVVGVLVSDGVPESHRGEEAQRLAADVEAVARTITNPFRLANALTDAARAAAKAGDPERAWKIASEAEAVARKITHPDQQSQALSGLAEALAQAGDTNSALDLIRHIAKPNAKASALADLCIRLGSNGQTDEGLALSRTISDPAQAVRTFSNLIYAFAAAGEAEKALAAAAEAEVLIDYISNPEQKAQASAELALCLARAKAFDQALVLTRSIAAHPNQQTRALTLIARSMALAKETEKARLATAEAEIAAHGISNDDQRARAYVMLVGALAETGQYKQGLTLARAITDTARRAKALIEWIRAVSETEGAVVAVDAQAITVEAEHVASGITSSAIQASALTELATIIAQTGDVRRARSIADAAHLACDSIGSPGRKASSLIALSYALAEAGDLQGTHVVLSAAERVAREVVSTSRQARALTDVARALADTGHSKDAERLTSDLAHPDLRIEVLEALAEYASRRGDSSAVRRCVALALTLPVQDIGALTTLVCRQVPEAARAARITIIACANQHWFSALESEPQD